MSAIEARPSIGPVQVGVILLALAAGIIHLYLFLIEGFLGDSSMLPFYQVLFVANFFGYVTLAAALYLPIPLLARLRPVVRVLLISMTVAAIVSYFYVNVIDALGNITQVIEILLIVLVTVETSMASREGDEGARGGVLRAAIELVISIVLGIAMVFVMFLLLRPLLESFL